MSDAAGTRCVALVGPYLSGKTTLLESMLFVSGGTHRRGSVKEGNSVGDSAAEARARQMSVELSVGSTEYLGEKWTILDCPGSIELFQEAVNALMVCDMAIVVFEPSSERVTTLAPLFKFLDEHSIPHMLPAQQNGYRDRARARRLPGASPDRDPPPGAAPNSHSRR